MRETEENLKVRGRGKIGREDGREERDSHNSTLTVCCSLLPRIATVGGEERYGN